MKKALFIDRDGALVIEPPNNIPLDSLEKLQYYPGVFRGLSEIAHQLDWELVMITGHKGERPGSFPEESFSTVQEKIIQTFGNEGIVFSDILVDRGLYDDNATGGKPRAGLFSKYLYGDYNLSNSYVIGDREADIQLASDIGAQGIFIGEKCALKTALTTKSWEEIYSLLRVKPRKAWRKRITGETQIELEINLDGTGMSSIATGLGFFDHMLEQIAKHGSMDIKIVVNGDLNIDEHHTIEDVAITLGEAFREALGYGRGIERYGFLLPMDDCLAQVAIDFGGRPWLIWDTDFRREMVGGMPTEMFSHFFKSFSDAAKCNLNIKSEGENEHHKIEAIFKSFAKAIKMAKNRTDNYQVPSTKGIL